jgi:hypothetical protein
MRKPIKGQLKIIFVCTVFLFITKGLCANDLSFIKYDSMGSLTVRNFDSEALRNYKSDPDFTYVEDLPENQNYELNWIARLLKKLFGFSFNKDTDILWEIVLYLVAGTILLFVIWNLLRADKSWFISRPGKNVKIKFEEIEHNIYEMDLDKLIREAIEQKQYRRAVRFLYLKSLKELSKKNLIQWSTQKTNSDYLSELKSGPLKKSFKSNTLIFEYIWYGEFHIDEQLLQKVKVSFDSFINQIQGK